MLVYNLIVSPGYYLDRNVPGFAVMFGTLLILSLVALAALLRGAPGGD